MPTYEYVCDACGHQFERFQSITAEPERTCPKCRKRKVRRKIGVGAGILFKGTGFYETDYRSDGYAKAAEADRKNSDTAKPADAKISDAKPETKAETKPASTSDTRPATPKPAKEPGVKALHPSREGRGQGNLRRSAPRARKSRRAFSLRKLVIALVIGVVVLLLAGILGIDVIARVGIQTVGSRVLGVPTSVRSVSIGLISDTSSVNGLAVANPAGYTDPDFLTLGRAALTARLGELTAETTTIRSVVIRDVVLTLEKDASGKLNADRISDNLPASPKDGSQPAKKPASGPSRTITVNEFRMEGVKVRLRNLVGGKAGVVEAALPDIALKDVRSDGSVDVLASQVSGVVIGSVLEATVKANIDGLSSEVVSGLKDAMKNAVDDLPADLRGPVESIRGGVGEALDEAGKGIGDALGNILGGKKGN
jgi:putative FmdB family regulatory protein